MVISTENKDIIKHASDALGALYAKHGLATALSILLSIFLCIPIINILTIMPLFKGINIYSCFCGCVAFLFIAFLIYAKYKSKKILQRNTQNKAISKFMDYLELAELRGLDSEKVQLAFDEGVDWFFECLLVCDENIQD